MYKISSQVIDFYDDKSLLLEIVGKEIPEAIKTAKILESDELPKIQDDYYAVVMMTKTGGKIRRYPTFDKEHTWLSCRAFEKTGHRLPIEAAKTAASNLYSMCLYHNLDCPEDIIKLAADIETNIVRIDESKDMPLEFYLQEEINKLAAVNIDESEYGVITSDGQKMYPLNTKANVCAAINFFEKKAHTILPHYRSQLAKNIYKFAASYGVSSPDSVAIYNADKGDNITFNLRSRAPLVKTAEERECIDELIKLAKYMDKDSLIHYITRFDKTAGIDKYWDRFIKNPYITVLEKIAVNADKSVHESEDDINEQDIIDYSAGFAGQDLPNHLPDEIVNNFISDPVGTFHNMSDIQQDVILSGVRGKL